MKIGFIGLGTMGLPMARNLLKAGHSLTVYNRTAAKAEELSGDGLAKIASTPATVAQESEILFTMLTEDAAVEEVYFGTDGIMEGLLKASNARLLRIAVDCSTIAPATSQKLSEALSGEGVEMLDAPVTGSKPQAQEGSLTFMVGGKEETFNECLPLFRAMGKKAVRLGANGAGSNAKLANNTMVAIHLLALSEALLMVKKSGVDPVQFLDVISGGGARSAMAEMKGPKIMQGDFEAQFMAKLMNKDLRLAVQLAETLQIPVPVLSAVKQQFQVALSSGYGEEDMCAVIKCYEEWSGVQVRE